VSCERYSGCENANLSCANPICVMAIGACRCPCTDSCPDGVCFGEQCLQCAYDSDCESHACTNPETPNPRCRPDTHQCSCSGECGDGVCDDYEEAARTCPQDCAGPCVEGEVLPFSCQDGSTFVWCRCEEETWVCGEPANMCTGDTACAQQGGQCVATEGDCFEGEIVAESHGCSGSSPLCCMAPQCFGPGEQYYPTLGRCCAGLRSLPALELMSGMHPDVEGVMCFASCWVQTCAPCADGLCQPHMGESFCTCPEDCPQPPYPLVCSGPSIECGVAYCQQEGDTCYLNTPRCEQNACLWDREAHPNHICNTAERVCEPS
jgi:hypothetical protein